MTEKSTKKERMVSEILNYWKIPKVFNPEKYISRFTHKYKKEEDAWKIEFQVEKKRRNHERVVHSAGVIADIAERIYGEKSN